MKLRLKYYKTFYEGNTITFIDNPEKEMPKGNSCYYDDDCDDSYFYEIFYIPFKIRPIKNLKPTWFEVKLNL